MNLAIDIGNSLTHFAVFKGSRMIYAINCPSSEGIKLVQAIKKLEKNFYIDSIGISSVSPKTLKHLKTNIRNIFKLYPLTISNKTKIPISIKVKKSHTLGADRICNAVFGYVSSGLKTNTLIIDLGTANTFDLVLKNGDFIGGIIAPGLMTSSNALNISTGKLPALKYTELSAKAPLIGGNTFEAIQSGLVNYMKFAIEGIVNAMRKQYKGKLEIYLTGGSARFIGKSLEFEYIYRENTVLEGINLILNYQRTSK